MGFLSNLALGYMAFSYVNRPNLSAYLGRLSWDDFVSDESPVITGTWVTVQTIVCMIVDGESWSTILRCFPEITPDDIRAALAYTIEAENL